MNNRTKFCSNCGESISYESKFCEFCGHQFEITTVSSDIDLDVFDEISDDDLEEEAKAEAEEEAKAKVEEEAKVKAEEEAKAKAEEEAKAKSEEEAKVKAETEAKLKDKAKAETEAKAKSEAKRKADIKAKAEQRSNEREAEQTKSTKKKSGNVLKNTLIFGGVIVGFAIIIGVCNNDSSQSTTSSTPTPQTPTTSKAPTAPYTPYTPPVNVYTQKSDPIDSMSLASLWNKGYELYKSKNYTEARKYLEKAAEKGDSNSQDVLGRMYLYGRGVTQSNSEALRWYKLAADQGDHSAQNALGTMYHDGTGVTTNYTAALKWYRLSADQENEYAQRNLGFMYENGHGVTRSYTEAKKWYTKALNNGYPDVQEDLDRIAKYITSVPKSDPLDSMSEVDLWNKGKELYNQKNYTEAYKYFIKGANNYNHSYAQSQLGTMYRNGYGVTQNHTEAVKWFRLSANQGDAFGQNNLGAAYGMGEGVTQNHAEAVKWYRLSADQENEYAQRNLGFMYENGYGVPQNYIEAKNWYTKALNNIYPHPSAQTDLDRIKPYTQSSTNNILTVLNAYQDWNISTYYHWHLYDKALSSGNIDDKNIAKKYLLNETYNLALKVLFFDDVPESQYLSEGVHDFNKYVLDLYSGITTGAGKIAADKLRNTARELQSRCVDLYGSSYDICNYELDPKAEAEADKQYIK